MRGFSGVRTVIFGVPPSEVGDVPSGQRSANVGTASQAVVAKSADPVEVLDDDSFTPAVSTPYLDDARFQRIWCLEHGGYGAHAEWDARQLGSIWPAVMRCVQAEER